MDSVYFAPWDTPDTRVSSVSRGQVLAMVLEYTVAAGPTDGSMDIIEIRQVTYAGNILVEVKDFAKKAPGKHKTLKKITLPVNATTGVYSYVGTVKMAGGEYRKQIDFTIQERPIF
jgi:hypothetical protein